jgi:hypothetical protein
MMIRNAFQSRTTNKIFKELVRNHIIECLDASNYDNTIESIKDKLQLVVDCFYTEFYYEQNKKRIPNKFLAFQSYLLGLPSCFNIEFEYYHINKMLSYWFTELNGSYNEMESEKEAELYYHLIIREFNVLCKQYKVEF